jgi:probable rRNA maturation factor
MILNRQRAVRLDRRSLEKFWRRVRDELCLGEAEVTICLVSDAEMARLNLSFRKKKGSTDVLSFPTVERRRPIVLERGLREKMRAEDLGDIAISPATARRNAGKFGKTLASEMRILILHGVLHLLGYDHETDRGQMNRIEQKLRLRLGLP